MHEAGDYYAELGLRFAAPTEDVEKAFRKLARQFHPDKLGVLSPEAQLAAKNKFQALKEAKEHILSHKDEYDAQFKSQEEQRKQRAAFNARKQQKIDGLKRAEAAARQEIHEQELKRARMSEPVVSAASRTVRVSAGESGADIDEHILHPDIVRQRFASFGAVEAVRARRGGVDVTFTQPQACLLAVQCCPATYTVNWPCPTDTVIEVVDGCRRPGLLDEVRRRCLV
ncbi:DnaJ domain [Carpediemonas membranifera]|uniref:DnaJ domain n=1 Tax=Carpediemonas membranifera TaxID=201153 RepID=A0A8J6E4L2_9EUKA|nr:DnaJ domain [Carpediemonas membranifera]|eukprot:KAG9397091.1 DnaJ domain [Carpediemonas membranifera]